MCSPPGSLATENLTRKRQKGIPTNRLISVQHDSRTFKESAMKGSIHDIKLQSTAIAIQPMAKTMPNSSNTPNLFLLLSTATLLFVAYAFHRRKPKQTNLVVYVHDYFSGVDASAVTVAGKLGAASNILHFGTVAVVDDVVTEGPEVESKVIGRAQGLYINSALDGMTLYMVFSVTFTEGQFKGSTLEIQGIDPFKLREREFGVVSGTGLFRFAKGYGIMETQHMDVANLRAIIKLNITLRHD